MKDIILLAPPAAGKGTQSAILEEKYGMNHISTGDLLREVASNGTEFGKRLLNSLIMVYLLMMKQWLKCLKIRFNHLIMIRQLFLMVSHVM
jgi:adenylate kinase family enzyme